MTEPGILQLLYILIPVDPRPTPTAAVSEISCLAGAAHCVTDCAKGTPHELRYLCLGQVALMHHLHHELAPRFADMGGSVARRAAGCHEATRKKESTSGHREIALKTRSRMV